MNNRDKKLIKIFLYIFSFVLIYYISLPLYSGGGSNILNKQENILSLTAQIQKIDQDIKEAKSLTDWAQKIDQDYKSITQETVLSLDKAIKIDYDLLRNLNDIVTIFQNRGIKISLPKYVEDKNKSLPGIHTYTYTVEAKSNYSELLSIIRDLNNSLQIKNIKNISISTNNDLAGEEIAFDITLENYKYNN